MILAQAIPPAAELASFLACVAFLIGILVGLKKLREKTPGDVPQPLKVQEQHEFTPLPLHNRLEERVSTLDERVEKRFAEAAQASSLSRGKIYDLLRAQGEQISALKADSASQTRQMHGLANSMEALPGRIIAMIDREPTPPSA
jgi:uncharacterized protein with von Willebrand factor type A (vWA) domain